MADFISRISVVCFAASYAVALACEGSRLLFRSGIRGAVMVGFAAAGVLAHTLFLGWRAANEPAARVSVAEMVGSKATGGMRSPEGFAHG